MQDRKQTWITLPMPQLTVLRVSRPQAPRERIQAEFRQLGSLRRFEMNLKKPRELEISGKICIETDLQRSAEGPCNTVKNI